MKTLKFITALLLSSMALVANATNVILHTNYGDIKIALDEKNAPISSKNFLEYSKSGFYDGTIFHRVIDGFMIQGGGFATGLKKKEANASIKNEADNGLKNQIGTIAMARTGDPHSATSQFFINVADNEFLNHKDKSSQGWGYAVFGKVVSGMDVVNKIAKVETGIVAFYRDVPKEEVIIKSVSVD